MKKLILITICLVASNTYAQQAVVGMNYITNAEVFKVVIAGSDKKKFTGSAEYTIPKDTKFVVNGISDDNHLIIQFWHWNTENTEQAKKETKKDTEQKDAAVKFFEARVTEADSMLKAFASINKTLLTEIDNLTKDSTGIAKILSSGDSIILKEKNAEYETNSKVIEVTENEKTHWDKLSKSIQYIKPKYIDGYWANDVDFLIPLTEFNAKCQKYYGCNTSFTWGALTIPAKLRFSKVSSIKTQNDESSSDKDTTYFRLEPTLNLGLSFGAKFQISSRIEQSFNLLVAAGISGVTIRDSTDFKKTRRITEGIYERPAFASTVKTSTSFTVAGGVVYSIDKFQVGAFIGFDFLDGNIGKSWSYQGAPWFGIGLGASIFSKDADNAGKGTN